MSRIAWAVAGLACALTGLAGCGVNSSAYSCSGGTCAVSFHNPGSVDLSDSFGFDARVEAKSIDSTSVDIATAVAQRRLGVGDSARLGPLLVRVIKLDGSTAKLRVEAARR